MLFVLISTSKSTSALLTSVLSPSSRLCALSSALQLGADQCAICNRGAAAQRPLFLAAPGVANAQSAYFSFSQFLQWSDQPIYVLDKDNDLNIAQLARQNAADIVKVQPEGPYLLGGHSYGGAVAMEVAMVLESWGHDIGAVLVRFACCVAFYVSQHPLTAVIAVHRLIVQARLITLAPCFICWQGHSMYAHF